MPMNPYIANKLGDWQSIELSAGCQYLAEDSLGCLWVGTQHSGAIRCDGREFKKFSRAQGLKHDTVYCLLEDRAGLMMIGTAAGLSCCDGETIVDSPLADYLNGKLVSFMLYDSRGRLWISIEGTVLRYDGQRFVTVTVSNVPGDSIHNFCSDSKGFFWIAAGSGVFKVDESDAIIPIDIGVTPGITGVCADAGGSMFVATTHGVFRYDGTHAHPVNAFANRHVRFITRDPEGNLWAALYGGGSGGVCCFDGERLVTFGAEDGLAARQAGHILADREDGIWFACQYGGITRYCPHGISMVCNDLVEHFAQGFEGDRMFWSSASRSLTYYEEGKTPRTIRFNEPGHAIIASHVAYADGKGRLWISGTEKVFRFESIAHIDAGPPQELCAESFRSNEWAWCFCEDRQSAMWIGTRFGLIRCIDDAATRIYDVEDPDHLNGVRALLVDNRDGSLWIAVEGRGIGRYHDGRFTWYTTEQGLSDNGVLCMVQDRAGAIWYGTQTGVGCFDGLTFKNISGDGGIDIDFTHRLFVDSSGHVWMGTIGRGVCRFDGRNFQFLTTNDGLPSNNVTGIMETSGGDLFFATYKGVCRYPRHAAVPPLIRILSADADRPYVNPKAVRLDTSSPTVRIRFRGTAFGTRRLRYRYRLEGFDPVWRSTWEEETTYRGLPEGEYAFKVAAVNRDLAVSDPPAELRITVAADPRDRMISELEARVRERTRELEEANRHLSDVNAELDDFAYAVSHDLKAPLRAITSLVNWVTEDYRDALGDDGREKLRLLSGKTDRMRALIDGILRYSRLGRTAQEQEPVDMAGLVREVIDLLAPPAQVTIVIEGAFPTIACDRVRMSEVFQNLISNAVRYGDASHNRIVVSCSRDGEYWQFRVADNGPGIDKQYHEKIFHIFETISANADAESTGVGLALVKKIVTMMGGSIRVESEPGRGAAFLFTIPAV